MRIAFIGVRGVPAQYSGFETCVEQVGSRMVAGGHAVTVFCRSGHYAERPPAYRGMGLHYLPAAPGKHTETLTHTALAARAAAAHDAIVCMGVGNAPVVRLLEAAGHRTVFNVDGADWQRAKWGAAASAYLRAAEVLAARARSVLVADARAVQAYYRERHARETEFIPYGAESPADGGTAALERFGLVPDGYLLFVGRLEPENGAHDFLEGYRLAGWDVPAVVVGDAVYPGAYVRQLRAGAPAGAVFTGFQFGAAYQQLSAHTAVFVLAATVGGTHPVLLEQMAAGNCILARDTPSNREVLGDAGLWWRTPGELAELLRRVRDDPSQRGRLGAAARVRQRDGYDWERVTDQYLELCRQVSR
jgi:glycosyltransferase involved in cell wall biosynthesis